MRLLRSLLASLVLLAAGCVFVVDDPDGWTVSPDTSSGPTGGSSAQGAGPGVSCYESDASCHCEATSPGESGDGTGPACGGDAHPDRLCCGDFQYAASNTSCECKALSCKLTADGCECYLGIAHGPDSSCLPRQGETCCQSTSLSCECGPDIFCSEGNEVPSCEVKNLRCDEQRFAFCSPLVSGSP